MAKTIDQIFKMSQNDETNGIVLDYDIFRVTVRRAGGSNAAYLRAVDDMHRRYRQQLERRTMSETVATREMAYIYASTVILGFEYKNEAGIYVPGIIRDTGIQENTVDNITQMLIDLPELFIDIKIQAQNLANFREAELSEDTGK